MKLFLIVDNQNPLLTCHSNCALYDRTIASCVYHNLEVPNDSLYTAKCNYFLDRSSLTEFENKKRNEFK